MALSMTIAPSSFNSWADVLAKKGAKRAAAAKYADALHYAPNWPELKQASGHSI